jgi:hypothetical protein
MEFRFSSNSVARELEEETEGIEVEVVEEEEEVFVSIFDDREFAVVNDVCGVKKCGAEFDELALVTV